MAAKRPYELFGSYLLFKRLETSRLGELWRAGKIDGNTVSDTVLLLKLTGGNRAAIRDAVLEARPILPSITGSTVARSQWADVAGDVPYIVFEYSSGQTLSHIAERARGGAVHPNPIPTDQALSIAEKLAQSLDTLNQLKYQGARLLHGALLPQFVWVTYDGEVRVAGQQLGKGLCRSLSVSEFTSSLGGYFAPELHGNQQPSRATEAYSVGAILYLLLTGTEPPDASDATAFQARIASAPSAVTGERLPKELIAILQKCLAIDPAARYASPDEFRQALSPLLHGGAYTATTFNLAFYLSNLLKKEIDAEPVEREKEQQVAVAPYLEQPAAPLVAPAAPVVTAPTFAASQPSQKSKLPLVAGIAAAVVLAGGAAAYLMIGKGTPPAPAVPAGTTVAAALPAPPKIEPIVESISATPATAPTVTASGTVDPEAEKKAFEDAVNRKLQEEMMKLQEQMDREMEKKRAKPAPALQQAAPAQTAPAEDRPTMTAQQMTAQQQDLQRRAAEQQQQPATIEPTTAAQPAVAAPQVAQAPARPAVAEGDLIELSSLDQAPKPSRSVKPAYPPIASRRKLEATVILSVLVSPSGSVEDVKILRGDNRGVGFDEAAMQAMRKWSFSPAVKEGKRVRTWMPVAMNFKL